MGSEPSRQYVYMGSWVRPSNLSDVSAKKGRYPYGCDGRVGNGPIEGAERMEDAYSQG